MIRYRAEIDGLRGLAVGVVVLFHAAVPGFSGGFVGVDVFFVISGYLITSLISGEIDQGTFTFAGFYERRARRILPALMLMLALTSIVAVFVLWPSDLVDFARDAVANLLFATNVVDWKHVDYFAAQSSHVALLHTWSLGVEEQFYFMFPLALWCISTRMRQWRVLVIGIAMIVSLGLCVAVTARLHVHAAFFLLPFRAWQLLAGSMIALLPLELGHGNRVGPIVAAAGLVGLAIIVSQYNEAMAYPGGWALWPTLCAALLIHGTGQGKNRVRTILRWRPLVGLGLVSYSLYLWHWPALVFARNAELDLPSTAVTVAAVMVSGLMAYLSWLHVERPFRDRVSPIALTTLLKYWASAAALITGVAAVVQGTYGLPGRYPENVRRYLTESRRELDTFRQSCVNHVLVDVSRAGLCTIGRGSASHASFALFGDSHAKALMSVFDSVARARGVSGEFISKGGCPPLLDVRTAADAGEECLRFRNAAIAYLKVHDIRNIVLVGYWRGYVERSPQGLPRLQGSDGRAPTEVVAATMLQRALTHTIVSLTASGAQVFVVGDVPSFDFDVPTKIARTLLRGGHAEDVNESASEHERKEAVATWMLRATGALPRTTVVDFSPAFCDASRCVVTDASGSLYLDAHHVSARGAMRLRARVDSMFNHFQ